MRNLKQPTKIEAERHIYKVAKQWQIQVSICETPPGYGGAWLPNKVWLSEKLTPQHLLNCFYHELGHQYCFVNGLFNVYHNRLVNTAENRSTFKKTALKAERYVDKWAEKQFKLNFPQLHYHCSYQNKKDVVFLQKHVETFLGK